MGKYDFESISYVPGKYNFEGLHAMGLINMTFAVHAMGWVVAFTHCTSLQAHSHSQHTLQFLRVHVMCLKNTTLVFYFPLLTHYINAKHEIRV